MKWFSRLFSNIAISIDSSEITCKKGKITPGLATDLRALASDLDLSKAEVWIDGTGKISFSREIPARYHQRFRNLLAGVHRPS